MPALCLQEGFFHPARNHAILLVVTDNEPSQTRRVVAVVVAVCSADPLWTNGAARLSAAEEDARDNLEYYATEDDEGEENEPDGGDWGLGRLLLGHLLDLLAGLAHFRLLLLGELEVRPSLLGSLRHGEVEV